MFQPPPPVAVRLDQLVVLNFGEPDAWCGTLGQLIAANGDGVSDDQWADVCTALARGEVYRGGGGAAAGFTVRRAPVVIYDESGFPVGEAA